MTTDTPCRRCGHLPALDDGEHACPGTGMWTGSDIIGGYLDTRDGTIRMWAYRLDCAAQGCDPPHPDGDRICAMTEDDFEHPRGLANTRVVGPVAHPHAVQILTRVVTLPPWSQARPQQG